MPPNRIIERYRTELIGGFAAIVLIIAGLVVPNFIPDDPTAPSGFQDATWIRTLMSLLLIGMGVVSFVWLVVIHRFIARKSKKEFMY
jgi:hypothetical protein